MDAFRVDRISWLVIALCWLVVAVGLFINISSPLQGHHIWRQADTLHVAYNYCKEPGAEFLRPRIGPRGASPTGVAIGEFPVWSYALALKCKLTGSWDEVTPKVLTWIFMALNVWLWGLVFRREDPARFPSWPVWITLFSLTPIFLVYLTVPIPDVFALALLGGVAALKDRRGHWYTALRILVFVTAFAIRPYFVPLLLVVFDRRWQWAVCLALCSLFYFLWFKRWVYTSDVHQWFGTELRSPIQLLFEIPKSIPEWFKQLFRDHTNFLGLIFLWLGYRAVPRMWWFVAVSGTVLVIGLRGNHFVIHGYYLLVPALVIAQAMARGYSLASDKWRMPVLAAMSVLGVIAVQHLYHTSRYEIGYRMRSEVATLLKSSDPFSDKLAVFGSESPVWHYRSLRVGWLLPREAFKGFENCPPGAKAAILMTENERDYDLKPCLNTNSATE